MKKHTIYKLTFSGPSLRLYGDNERTFLFLELPSPVDVARTLRVCREDLESELADIAEDEDSDYLSDAVNEKIECVQRLQDIIPHFPVNESEQIDLGPTFIWVAGVQIAKVTLEGLEAWRNSDERPE